VGSRYRALFGPYVRRAPNLSPALPDGGAAGRRACSSSISRVAGKRACPPFSKEPPENELALPQPEALLEDVLVSPQLVESLARACPPCAGGAPGVRSPSPTDGGVAGDSVGGMLPGDLRSVLAEEEPSERLWLSPFKLLFY